VTQNLFSPMAPADQRLLQAARAGLTLDDEPFADLGRALGLSGEAVVNRLRALAGSGMIDGMHLHCASVGGLQAQDAVGQNLLDALASGLPLVQRPYEALGALLGLPADAVRTRLAAWIQSGELLRIAPTRQGLPVEP
jgi:DNA-binding Lrp family transcriptional regulator